MCKNERESISFWQQYVFYHYKICGSVRALLYLDKIQTTFIFSPPSALSHTNMWSHTDVKSLRDKLVYPDPPHLGLFSAVRKHPKISACKH